MGRPVIFCVPHPDDETLGAGVSIAEHVAAGRDVRVLLMTRGTSSGALWRLNGGTVSPWWGVAHNPVQEGYLPFTPESLGAARRAEITSALACLGVTADRIYEASDLIGEPVTDGSITEDQARRAILALVGQLDPAAGNPGLWGPTWLVDDNPDHTNVGLAIKNLGETDPRLTDRRYWVIPPYWTDARLTQIGTEFWDLPATTAIANQARNACRAYSAWNPAAGSFAIGYHSAAPTFEPMDGAPGSATSARCLIHK